MDRKVISTSWFNGTTWVPRDTWFGTWKTRDELLVTLIWNPWEGMWQSRYKLPAPFDVYGFWDDAGNFAKFSGVFSIVPGVRSFDICTRVSGRANELELRHGAK
jgi:hypothetical protein